MATHESTVAWCRGYGEVFTDNRYARRHEWRFDGGAVVAASSSPHVVRLPLSDPTAVDPEEAFVAALASCHMLFFLFFAAADGWTVERYVDSAHGTVEKKQTTETHIKSHKVAATKDDPQYIVESATSGKQAAHKPDELRKK